MSNFLSNKNLLSIIATASIGSTALTGCSVSAAPKIPESYNQVSGVCTGRQEVVVEDGDTLTGLVRKHVEVTDKNGNPIDSNVAIETKLTRTFIFENGKLTETDEPIKIPEGYLKVSGGDVSAGAEVTLPETCSIDR